jgi:hypothetical protein
MLVHALLSCQAAQTWHADNCLLALIPAAAENPTGGWSVPLWVGEGSCSHVLNARHQIRISPMKQDVANIGCITFVQNA